VLWWWSVDLAGDVQGGLTAEYLVAVVALVIAVAGATLTPQSTPHVVAR
jgi:hypothetical protein